ncbi:LacI family DNA-binding transcriptional regulator [Curtobacterium sp. VKM Ac-2865]|uniref:LacI family DNA-binding transcriptional regulator n=1 Tax=Curtobacterium sp. VKM Ac-2865 TaxID=2783817 RepID=UPI00188B8D6D|nr:LacI family DNA-binding transcriptional regulator [Curtobacterium sp. VKM Ac-2865]MBF4582814.1 LacI family DNA-binding transcriptional regulator [Curtobacterium sp. VKM Ac-2865]
MAVTLADVALRAGVSITTASRVLARSRTVSPGAQAAVERAATELGYAGNGVARALRRQRTDAVGMVVPSIRNPFFTALVDAVERTLQTTGRVLYLCDARDDVEVEARHLRSLVARGVDGIVVSPCADDRSTAAVVEAAAHVPLVQLDRHVPEPVADWVGLDDRVAMDLVVGRLAERGVRSAGFVTASIANSSTRERAAGFADACARFGIRTDPRWTVPAAFTIADGVDAGARFVELGTDRPAAVVCADDLLAIGVTHALVAGGLRIPEDVAVTGLDDLEFARYVTPPLTTVRQPTTRMAEEVLRLLDRAPSTDRTPGVRIALPPALVVRASA